METNAILLPNQLALPDEINRQYDKLCKLIDTSVDGKLESKAVAEYYGASRQWLLDAVGSGGVPFAFGDVTGSKGRRTFQFGILPLYCFETQGILTRIMLWNKSMAEKAMQ